MIIGVCGVSRSGKSTLSKNLEKKISNSKVIHQDHFVKKREKLLTVFNPVDKIEEIDWDTPNSIDFDAFYNEIITNIQKYPVLIIEGFLLYEDHRVVSLLDMEIIIEVSKETFFKRRRDPTSEWGVESEWYTEFVWDCYLKYKKDRKNAILINGNVEVRVIEENDHIYIQNGEKLIKIL